MVVFLNIVYYIAIDTIMAGKLPVNASVVVVPIEELDLLKGLLAGVVTGQVRVHAKEQVQRGCPWEGNKRIKESSGEKWEENSKRFNRLTECVCNNKCGLDESTM